MWMSATMKLAIAATTFTATHSPTPTTAAALQATPFVQEAALQAASSTAELAMHATVAAAAVAMQTPRGDRQGTCSTACPEGGKPQPVVFGAAPEIVVDGERKQSLERADYEQDRDG